MTSLNYPRRRQSTSALPFLTKRQCAHPKAEIELILGAELYHIFLVHIVRCGNDVQGVSDRPEIQRAAWFHAVLSLAMARFVQIALDQNAEVLQQFFLNEKYSLFLLLFSYSTLKKHLAVRFLMFLTKSFAFASPSCIRLSIAFATWFKVLK